MTTHPQPADAADQRARQEVEQAMRANGFARPAPNSGERPYFFHVIGELRFALADAYREIEALQRLREKQTW